MPNSRGRPRRRHPDDPRRRSRQEKLPGLLPHIALMQQADDAERRGDALSAIEIMMRRPLDPDGRPFWRPWRVRRLSQIARLAPLLPDWAIARWLLAQALQSLHPQTRSAYMRAVEIAIDLRGGLSGLPGVDDDDRHLKVVDHDWVYRQVFLYELGGLARFLRHGASSELVADAGPVVQWTRVPMGAYRLVERRPGVVVWHDLAAGVDVDVVNTGCAGLFLRGEHALGRIVPTAGMPIFESVPLLVEESCAAAVAADPASWLEVLRADPPRIDGVVATAGYDFDLLSDLPDVVWLMALAPLPDVEPATIAAAVLERARALLRGELMPDADLGDPDHWATLVAAILEPGTIESLCAMLGPDDQSLLAELGLRLAEPAGSVCRELAAESGRAA